MNSSLYKSYKIIIVRLAAILVLLLVSAPLASAADDPSIKGDLRENIRTSMLAFIKDHMIDNTYILYDAVDGRLLNLKLHKLHDGIVKKEGFYVSCADFYDKDGKKVDVDFLVIEDGEQLKTIQGVVHSVDGVKRQYHLEN